MGAENRASAKEIIAVSPRGLEDTSKDVNVSLNEKYGVKSVAYGKRKGLGTKTQ